MMKTLLKTPLSNVLVLAVISLGTISCSKDDSSSNITEKTEPSLTTATQTTTEQQSADQSGDQSDAETLAHGEEAHKNHCYKCHTDEVYTREDRFVKSIDALSKQVLRCKEGNDVPWFDEDSDAVVQFLNKKYYRF